MADWRKDPKMRWVVFGVVIMTAIGFSFGILLSAQQVVDTPTPNDRDELELPESDYQTEPFDLTVSQQSQLAQMHEVVFVNAYVDEEDEETQQIVQELLNEFGGKVHIAESTSAVGLAAADYGLVEEDKPQLIVVGYQGETPQDLVRQVDEPITQDIANYAVCEVMFVETEYSDICL